MGKFTNGKSTWVYLPWINLPKVFYRWGVVNILWNSRSLALMFWEWIYFDKRIAASLNDTCVCRTAPTTPGLLNISDNIYLVKQKSRREILNLSMCAERSIDNKTVRRGKKEKKKRKKMSCVRYHLSGHRCHMSHVMCHVICVTWWTSYVSLHLSPITYHLSPVNCQ